MTKNEKLATLIGIRAGVAIARSRVFPRHAAADLEGKREDCHEMLTREGVTAPELHEIVDFAFDQAGEFI